jgi:hypothetical protein
MNAMLRYEKIHGKVRFTNSSFGINSGKTTVVAVGCSRAPKPLRHFPA